MSCRACRVAVPHIAATFFSIFSLLGITKTIEKPRVKELRAYVVQKDEAGADYHRQQSGHWIIDTPISNPMSVYPPYRKSRVR